MKEVLAYLATLPPAERVAFASRCGTTVGYLRKAASVGQQIGGKLAICIERESHRAVTVEQLMPDADWAFIRGTNSIKNQPSAQAQQAQAAINSGEVA